VEAIIHRVLTNMVVEAITPLRLSMIPFTQNIKLMGIHRVYRVLDTRSLNAVVIHRGLITEAEAEVIIHMGNQMQPQAAVFRLQE
jgi:hypothetical protein